MAKKKQSKLLKRENDGGCAEADGSTSSLLRSYGLIIRIMILAFGY